MAGSDARPRPDQARAVEHLVEGHRRVLVVQATGWGKSAVYWAATAALGAKGAGPTLVVSPLLALMQDQIAAAACLDAGSDRSCDAGRAAGGDGELDQRRGVGRGAGSPAIRADRCAAHLPGAAVQPLVRRPAAGATRPVWAAGY